MSTQTAILIGLAVYGGLMFCVSLYFLTRVKKAEEYLLAGRGLPCWVLTGTIVGTCIGTGVAIGSTGLAYQHGWAGCVYPLGLGFGTVLAGWFFARMRRFRFMTLSEEVACYYGGNRAVVEISNISLFVSQLCWLTVQIKGGAAVLGAVTGQPIATCTLISGIITAMISIPGGLKTVVYTDFFQATILLCGFGCLTESALSASGGLDGLRNAVPPEYFSFLGVDSYGGGKIASLLLVLVLGVVADPGRRLTMFSAHTESGAKWSMVMAGAIVMVFSVVVGIVGMYAFRLNPHLPAADQALPWLVMNVLPPWLAAFVVVSVASAVFSSANGNAAAAGTFFIRHIFPLAAGHFPAKPLITIRRALSVGFVLATAAAMFTGSIVGFVAKFLPVTMSGLAVIILIGRFWPRATWQGALAALVAAPLVSLTAMLLPATVKVWHDPIILGTIAGLLAHIIVSSATTPGGRSFAEVAELMANERRAVEGGGHAETQTPGPYDSISK